MTRPATPLPSADQRHAQHTRDAEAAPRRDHDLAAALNHVQATPDPRSAEARHQSPDDAKHPGRGATPRADGDRARRADDHPSGRDADGLAAQPGAHAGDERVPGPAGTARASHHAEPPAPAHRSGSEAPGPPRDPAVPGPDGTPRPDAPSGPIAQNPGPPARGGADVTGDQRDGLGRHQQPAAEDATPTPGVAPAREPGARDPEAAVDRSTRAERLAEIARELRLPAHDHRHVWRVGLSPHALARLARENPGAHAAHVGTIAGQLERDRTLVRALPSDPRTPPRPSIERAAARQLDAVALREAQRDRRHQLRQQRALRRATTR